MGTGNGSLGLVRRGGATLWLGDLGVRGICRRNHLEAVPHEQRMFCRKDQGTPKGRTVLRDPPFLHHAGLAQAVKGGSWILDPKDRKVVFLEKERPPSSVLR